jgi:hypothetical protein
MAEEKSIFHTTGVAGDGEDKYSQEDIWRWLRQTFLSDPTTQGVVWPSTECPTPLRVTASAGSVSVAAGGALVYGCPHWSTGALTKPIPAPSSSTRKDLIVLRLSWADHTVRVTHVAGTEGGDAPALVQEEGTTWDIPLAEVAITTAGAITVTDRRVPLPVMGRLALDNFPAGLFTADEAGRAPFANGFVTDEMLAGDFVRANDMKLWNIFGLDDDVWPIPSQGTLSWLDIDFVGDATKLDFTLNGACDLLIMFSCTVKAPPGGTMDFRAYIDDSVPTERLSEDGTRTGASLINAHWYVENVQAGAHFVRIQFRHNGGAAPGIGTRHMSVLAIPK